MSDETRVDVLAVMEAAARVLRTPVSENGARELDKARAAVAELIETLKMMESTLATNTEWDEGCLYYNGISVPELQEPLKRLAAALSTIRSTL